MFQTVTIHENVCRAYSGTLLMHLNNIR